MDKLNEKLISIERALGGEPVIPQTDDVLGWHLDYIESLIEEGGGGGGEGIKVVDFGTIDGDISDPDHPYMASITQEQFEEALEADVAQFFTESDGGVTFRATKMQVMTGVALFTSMESEKREIMVMVMEQDSAYMLVIAMTSRFFDRDDKIPLENISTSGASDGQVITYDANDGVVWKNGGGSGGTQLYKHMAKIYAVGDSDPEYIYLMLISWLNTSFEGLHWKDLNGKYIGAFVVKQLVGFDWITPVITIVNDNDNVQVIVKDQYGSDMSYLPDWDSEYSCYIIEDTITSL